MWAKDSHSEMNSPPNNQAVLSEALPYGNSRIVQKSEILSK